MRRRSVESSNQPFIDSTTQFKDSTTRLIDSMDQGIGESISSRRSLWL